MIIAHYNEWWQIWMVQDNKYCLLNVHSQFIKRLLYIDLRLNFKYTNSALRKNKSINVYQHNIDSIKYLLFSVINDVWEAKSCEFHKTGRYYFPKAISICPFLKSGCGDSKWSCKSAMVRSREADIKRSIDELMSSWVSRDLTVTFTPSTVHYKINKTFKRKISAVNKFSIYIYEVFLLVIRWIIHQLSY